MINDDIKDELINSDMEKWLRERNMSTNKFVEMVGCSRTVVWRVKKGLAITPYFADIIKKLTNGEIKPHVMPSGRPW